MSLGTCTVCAAVILPPATVMLTCTAPHRVCAVSPVYVVADVLDEELSDELSSDDELSDDDPPPDVPDDVPPLDEAATTLAAVPVAASEPVLVR
ncbi:hypothetical protein GCM10028814_15860 [Angustibacter aerolatus]